MATASGDSDIVEVMKTQKHNRMKREKSSNAEVVLERGHAMTTLNIINECWQGSSSCEV